MRPRRAVQPWALPMAHRELALLLPLLFACGSSADSNGGSSESSTGAVAESGDESSTGEDIELTHGSITLELVRSEGAADNPYTGTTRVVATLAYQACLSEFYAAHPELAQGGEEGATIFGSGLFGGEAWMDRLCKGGGDTQAECTVQEIAQDLGAKTLRVTYAITGELEDHTLRFGPLPTTTTAGCPDPIVRVPAMSALSGEDADGRAIWATNNLSDIDAITNQPAAVVIRAAALE